MVTGVLGLRGHNPQEWVSLYIYIAHYRQQATGYANQAMKQASLT